MNDPLRLATPSDTETVLGLIRAYYAYDEIPFNQAIIRHGLEELLADESLGQVWLIQHEGQDVGYVVVTFAFDLEFGGREAFITDLFIVAEYRGKGLGTRTVQAIERMAPGWGVRALELQVERNNPQAQALYRKLGFQSHDRIPMSKDLS